jgi:hypothetical protein
MLYKARPWQAPLTKHIVDVQRVRYLRIPWYSRGLELGRRLSKTAAKGARHP